MIRFVLPVTAAALMVAASAMPAAAVTHHRTTARHTYHPTTARTAARAPARTRDGGSAAVDALNEQSLRTARGQ